MPVQPPTVVIALLGAECTGKSTLAHQLFAGLNSLSPGRVVAVDEHLRNWCLAQGRAPHDREQAAIAHAQQLAVEAALQQVAHVGPHADGEAEGANEADATAAPNTVEAGSVELAAVKTGWVIADTSPLQTAAYSGFYFSDDTLTPQTADWHRATVNLTLLMGLDLPWQPDGFLRDGPAAQLAVDNGLRATLRQHRVPFQTVYGHQGAREAAAWQALAAFLGPLHPAHAFIKKRAINAHPLSDKGEKSLKFQILCEHCDNAECEHRLFRRLTAGRS